MNPRGLVESILDLARWAPSGDNTQPWRFEIRSHDQFLVHGYDTHTHCVYDLDGSASQFAHGTLLETVALAATRFGHRAEISTGSADGSGHIVYRVSLVPASGVTEDPLVPAIAERSVQRRPMSPRPLSEAERVSLEKAVAPYQLVWMETSAKRWRMAAMNAFSAHIRLTIPEAFAVHKATIEWGVRTSEDRMPSKSLGAPWFFEPVMHRAMSSWKQIDFLNRYAGGTIMPRLLLDWWPALMCSAGLAVVAPTPPGKADDFVAAGRTTQRLWLMATRLGLQVQPLYTPLVFASYARAGRHFTVVDAARARAGAVAERLDRMFGADVAARAVFLARIGPKRDAKGRSLRLPLERLLVSSAPETI